MTPRERATLLLRWRAAGCPTVHLWAGMSVRDLPRFLKFCGTHHRSDGVRAVARYLDLAGV